VSTVLLFGSAGFLGTEVRRALTPQADLVCPGRADFDLFGAEVADLTALVRRVRPDAVVNCAGRLSGSGYDLVRAQTEVTAKLIEAVAAAAPAARLVRFGSAAEYGPVPHGQHVGEDDLARPASEYGVSHLAGTSLLELACAAGRVDGVVLRVFNPVGPGLPAENALGRAAAQMRSAMESGSDSIAMGPLDAYRDFVDVRDVALAVRAAVLAPELTHRVFNIGSGRAVSTRDAVRLLALTAGFAGEVREASPPPARSAAVPWMCADIGRAARALGWAPRYQLADSLAALWSGAK
jgi:NDP-hexose 4-ketoreductase